MKRTLLAILLSVITLCASAQFRWGATAGATFTDLNFSQDLFTVDRIVGGSAGVKGELMFPGIGFGVEFGALYEMRGAKLHMGEKLIWSSQGFGTTTDRLHYLDIPFHLKFKWTRLNGIEDYWAPFIQGGPTLNILLAHSKNEALSYSRAALGLTAGLGFELFKRWQIAGYYTWGMTHAVKTRQLKDFSAKSATWDIRLTYFF